MTPEQIREIVKITLDELTQRKLIKDDYIVILDVVEKKLKDFFNNKGSGRVGGVLMSLSDDPYIDIIFLQYRDGKTIEWIAEVMEVEVRTIMRNKKRIIKRIYELLEV